MKRVVLHSLLALSGGWIVAGCLSNGNTRHVQTREEALAEDSLLSVEEEEYETEEEDVFVRPRAMDEYFDDFIFNYASSKRMQKERTNFPLHLNFFGSDMVIEREEWQHEAVFTNEDYYTVFLNCDSDIDLETDRRTVAIDMQQINAKDSTMRTFHFDRQDGKWKLTREVVSDLDENPLADFYYFYHRFSTDSIFQRSSIARPLKYITSDPEDDFNTIEGTLTPDQWFAFCPEMPQGILTNILFGQTYDQREHVIMHKRGISNGMLDIFTFTMHDGEWKLTAYEN